MKYLLAIYIMMIFSIAGCGSESQGNPADTSTNATAAADTPTNRIDIPPSVRQNLGITFATVEKRRIAHTITVPGQFELTPQARQEYRATLAGRVDYLVQQFDHVEIGAVLFRMHSPHWPELQREISDALYAIEKAQSNITVADAQVTETESRIQLFKQRIAALAEVEIRRAELEQQLAELEVTLPRQQAQLEAEHSALAAAKRQYDHVLNRAAAIVQQSVESLLQSETNGSTEQPRWQTINAIEVTASTAGVVETIGLTPGGWAEVGAHIITVVNPTNVRFRAMGLQADLLRLRDDLPCRIMPPSTGESIEPIPAQLTIGLEADPQRRTVALLATPTQSATWARPGISAFLEIETTGTGGESLSIPRSAVIQDGLTHIIFRRDPANPDKVIRLEADLGESDGRWVAIESGVKLGDQIVLNGNYELKLATSATAQKGGHFHADGTFHAEDE